MGMLGRNLYTLLLGALMVSAPCVAQTTPPAPQMIMSPYDTQKASKLAEANEVSGVVEATKFIVTTF